MVIILHIKLHEILEKTPLGSDGTIPKFTSIPMPIPIKCSISIPILNSSYNISCGG